VFERVFVAGHRTTIDWFAGAIAMTTTVPHLAKRSIGKKIGL
jgi:hypothetical protein